MSLIVIAQLESLTEVRKAIDRLDREIVRLLGERTHYVHEAARFKKSMDEIAAKERVAGMLQERRTWATVAGVDPDLVEQLFRLMVQHFIAEETMQWKLAAASADGDIACR